MNRRELRFSTLEDIKSDLSHLQSQGYVKTGNWDLAQMSNHLADWMCFPMDGFPKTPIIVRMLLGIMRVTRGKTLLKKISQDQRMSVNQPTMPLTVYGADDPSSEGGLKRLVASMDRLTSYRGPIHPSPLFGELNYDELVALQLAHCAHHLSFLVPKH